MNVNFCYSQDVFTPKHLAGKKGDNKSLNKADAEELQRLGYGKIIETETKTQSLPAEVSTKAGPQIHSGDKDKIQKEKANGTGTKTEPTTGTKT